MNPSEAAASPWQTAFIVLSVLVVIVIAFICFGRKRKKASPYRRHVRKLAAGYHVMHVQRQPQADETVNWLVTYSNKSTLLIEDEPDCPSWARAPE